MSYEHLLLITPTYITEKAGKLNSKMHTDFNNQFWLQKKQS